MKLSDFGLQGFILISSSVPFPIVLGLNKCYDSKQTSVKIFASSDLNRKPATYFKFFNFTRAFKKSSTRPIVSGYLWDMEEEFYTDPGDLL